MYLMMDLISIFLVHKECSGTKLFIHFFILRHMSSNLRIAGGNLLNWSRSFSALANRYVCHLLIFGINKNLQHLLTKLIFQHVPACSGHFYSYSGRQASFN